MFRKRKTDPCGQYSFRGMSCGEAASGLGGRPSSARLCTPQEVSPETGLPPKPLLVGVEPKDASKPKIRRRKDLLLAVCMENTRDLSQSIVC